MKIDSLRVRGLFEHFNHDLEFGSDERIIIMTGQNGSGKTMILRIIDVLFNQPLLRLVSIPFREVRVSFDDGSNLTVIKAASEEKQGERDPEELKLIFQSTKSGEKTFLIKAQVDPKELGFPIEMIEDIIPVLTQIGPRKWRDLRTGNVLALEDVVVLFGDELTSHVGELSPASPKWLQDIRESIAVRLIDTERLTSPKSRQIISGQRYGPRVARDYLEDYPKRTVRLYSEELAEQVQRILAEYGSLSQSLDRTFPVRLVEEHKGSDSSMETLRQELSEIEEKRSKLVEAGILAQEPEGLASSALEGVDESHRGVLAVYAQDAKRKLSVFDDLYQRVDTFRRIANSRFSHKRVMVRTSGLSVVNSDGSQLDLEMLSSGEQHELVILYELLFRIPDNSLILIDEPELSLHVAWQAQFLKDLETMATLSNFHAILATHSPEIIGDRWDLTITLQGPNGG